MWSRRPRKVLIASLPPATSGLHPAFLRLPEIEALESSTGTPALGAARREHPELIIQDGGGSPTAALEAVRAFKIETSTRGIPLIAVIERHAEGAALAAGADAVVGKPVVQREYWETVRRFVPLPRRRQRRHTINLRFSYRVGERSWQAFSRDISTYGAFLKTDHALAPGAHLSVQFTLPGDSDKIACGAIVRHASTGHPPAQAGFAVEFEGLADSDGTRLDRFLSSHSRRSLFGLLVGIVVPPRNGG